MTEKGWKDKIEEFLSGKETEMERVEPKKVYGLVMFIDASEDTDVEDVMKYARERLGANAPIVVREESIIDKSKGEFAFEEKFKLFRDGIIDRLTGRNTTERTEEKQENQKDENFGTDEFAEPEETESGAI